MKILKTDEKNCELSFLNDFHKFVYYYHSAFLFAHSLSMISLSIDKERKTNNEKYEEHFFH